MTDTNNSTSANANVLLVSDKTDKIFHALKLVPNFDGNSNVLIRFLNICEQLVLAYVDPTPGNELNNYAVINGILNKITGPAARTLATNGIPSDWNGIRAALINSFSDHRDESSLYSDLSTLSQGNDTPNIFYERIQNLLSTIMTYVELHDNLDTTVDAKRTLYKKLALQTYLKGLREPLGSRVRCMRPPTLEKALEFAQEELNIIYLQNKNSTAATNSARLHNLNNSKSFNNVPFKFTNEHSNFVPMQQNFNYRTLHQGPSKTQQAFRALPRSNMSTGFKIPPRQQQHQQLQHRQFAQLGPQPMSGISYPRARTLPPTQRHDWNRHNNQHPTNNHREVNFNEHDDFYYDNDNYENDNYENFDIDTTQNYDSGCVTDHLLPSTDYQLLSDTNEEVCSDQGQGNFHQAMKPNAPE